MAGRKTSVKYQEMNYKLIKLKNKQVAHCNNCKHTLQNTATSRLIAHRNHCGESKVIGNTTLSAIDEVEIEFIDLLDNDDLGIRQPLTSIALSNDPCNSSSISSRQLSISTLGSNSSDMPSTSDLGIEHIDLQSNEDASTSIFNSIRPSCATTSNNQRSKPKPKTVQKRRSISTYVDIVTPREKTEIQSAIGNFFFGCNIPLRIIESNHFKAMINKLRPAFTPLLPNRRTISSSILDETYKTCLLRAKNTLCPNSVLVIDGWKNSSSNAKTVVTMVHNSDGSKAMINAWDLSGESETADRLAQIVLDSKEMAKELYNVEIYAVVSDNAATMIKMGKDLKHELWHSTCNSHIGNLLIKDLIDLKLIENVNKVLKEFKNADFEKQIVDKGGFKIKLACDTRWCSYRNAYKSLISNLQFMKQVVIDEQPRKIKAALSKLIFDDEFIEQVKAATLILDPVCELINYCQKMDASVADAVDLWLSLDVEIIGNKLKNRRDMALNVYALTAYYFHPTYENSKLKTEHMSKINNFLLSNLSGDGLDELDQFKMNRGVFAILQQKKMKKADAFWRTAEMNYPELSKLALKVINIPASSAQIERVFSNWGLIHTPIRNRLTFDRSKKLLHVYFSLNNKEELLNNPFDSDEDENC